MKIINNAKTPQIRFDGFSDDWTEIKLGEVLIKNLEKNIGKIISNVESISNKYGFVKQSEYFDDRQIASKDTSNYYIIKKGAFAYNPSRINVGSIAIKENDDISIVSPLYISFYTKNELENSFLWNWFKTSIFESSRQFFTNGGVRDTLSFDALSNISILIPSLPEQKKIGEFFNNLDNLIDAEQKKLDNLKQLKKGYLQQLFPQDGEKFPRVRFPEFSDPWSIRKLSDFIETSKEKNRKIKFSKQDVLSVSGEHGIVNQIQFKGRSFAGVSVAEYGVVNVGDIVYTKSPLKSNPYGIIKTNILSSGIVSTLYAVYKPRLITNSLFVQYYFENDFRLNSYLEPLVNKGAKNDMKVSDDSALMGDVIFPCRKEQDSIVAFFRNLDCLIDAEQKKLDSLKAHKKGMLQKMFV